MPVLPEIKTIPQIRQFKTIQEPDMMRKTVFSLDREGEVDTLMSPRPPTGHQLNPLIVNRMNVRYKKNGGPVQRSILGQPALFNDR